MTQQLFITSTTSRAIDGFLQEIVMIIRFVAFILEYCIILANFVPTISKNGEHWPENVTFEEFSSFVNSINADQTTCPEKINLTSVGRFTGAFSNFLSTESKSVLQKAGIYRDFLSSLTFSSTYRKETTISADFVREKFRSLFSTSRYGQISDENVFFILFQQQRKNRSVSTITKIWGLGGEERKSKNGTSGLAKNLFEKINQEKEDYKDNKGDRFMLIIRHCENPVDALSSLDGQKAVGKMEKLLAVVYNKIMKEEEEKSNERHQVDQNNSIVMVVVMNLDQVKIDQCGQRDQNAVSKNICSRTEFMKCTYGNRTLNFRMDAYNCCCSIASYFDRRITFCYSPLRNVAVINRFIRFCPGFNSWNEKFGYRDQFRRVLLFVSCLFCIAIFVAIVVELSRRSCQVWRQRKPMLTEMSLVGALLLYSTISLEYFPPSNAGCCALIWCRALGFVAFYGSMTLKLRYQIVENRAWRSQKNNSREKDLLKQVCSFLAFAAVGLTSWTVTSLEIMHINRRKLHDMDSSLRFTSPSSNIDGGHADPSSIIMDGKTELVSIGRFDHDGDDLDIYLICTIYMWHYAWHTIETIVLMYGLYLCYKTKSNKLPQRRQFAAAILIEITCTSIVNAVRYKFWLTTHPNILYCLTFIHVHCTITVILLISILSKFYHARLETANLRNRSLAGSVSNKAHPSLARLRDRLMNGTVDFAEVPIAEMNPEDIKAELKRVYTQLRMYKLTNLYVDNPHLNKRKAYKKSAHPLSLTSSSKRASTTNIVRTNKSSKTNANSIKELAPEEKSLISDATIVRELDACNETDREETITPDSQQQGTATPVRSTLVTFQDATKILPTDGQNVRYNPTKSIRV